MEKVIQFAVAWNAYPRFTADLDILIGLGKSVPLPIYSV